MITWHIEKRKLSTLNPSQNNPRKPTKTGLNDLETSLTDIGLASPINIEINGNILSGHMRYEVLKKQGVKEIDVYVPDRELTQKEKDAVMIRMNKQIAGEWDIDALANNFELDDLVEFGFAEDELMKFDPVEEEKDEDKLRDKKYIIEVQLPNELDMRDLYDDLTSKGYMVKEK